MKISYSKNFIKQAKKLPNKVQIALQSKLKLFAEDPLDSRLRNHALKGEYKSYRSIDITGDFRALYLTRDDEAVFDVVGTHSQLYK